MRLICEDCGLQAPRAAVRCGCGGLLAARLGEPARSSQFVFDGRRGGTAGGVWRFREWVHDEIADEEILSIGEGETPLWEHRRVTEFVGARTVQLKHEGLNPTGSFKDRGMTVALSEARRLGARGVACASTGNTSASMAAYAARGGLAAAVFIPAGQIAHGKLAQALAYGARVLQLDGNFDTAMKLVEEVAAAAGLYLVNSVNPWRLQGQKTIVWDLLQQRGWRAPDWLVVPAGNLGNTSAFGQALGEAQAAGFIDGLPRLAAIQAEGAAPFYRLWRARAAGDAAAALVPEREPRTLATAIRIGNPVSWRRALAALAATNGVAAQVSDDEILEAKAVVDAAGIGCEPASAAAVAGARRLIDAGVIARDAEVVCVLTGHLLKDPEATVAYHTEQPERARANPPRRVAATLAAILAALEPNPTTSGRD